MSLNIVSLESFSKEVKRLQKKYRQIAKDLRSLQQTLGDDPKAGIDLGRNCYKIRLENSSIPTGKRGGFRVVYYFLDAEENLYLMSIYSKTELEHISDDRLLEILSTYL